jgi:RimJ/RimL family protein N-acetyltransferase
MADIETDRLHLRPVAARDVAVLGALWNDPEVGRFLWDGAPVAREQTEAEIERSCASFAARGFGQWLVMVRTRESAVGFCGLRLAGEPAEVEVLYGIDPLQWSLGLATESASAVLRYGFDTLGLESIVASADEPNHASFRVMEKLGMRFVRRSGDEDAVILHYAVSRAAFRPREGWYRVIEVGAADGN